METTNLLMETIVSSIKISPLNNSKTVLNPLLVQKVRMEQRYFIASSVETVRAVMGAKRWLSKTDF